MLSDEEGEEEEDECKEYYDDYWIFGEGAPLGPKQKGGDGNSTEEGGEEEEEEGGTTV